MRRPRGHVALTVAFVLLALNAWGRVVAVPLGHSGDPPVLTALQALVGLTGMVTAWGSWTAARWAPASAVIYGVVAGSMLVALPSLLGLDVQARNGIWSGAAAVFVFSMGSAWYLRRSHQPA